MHKELMVAALFLGLVSNGAQAGESLREIMRDLGAETGRLAEALTADDLAEAAEAAQAIADHPRPPLGERARILGRLGSDTPAFRAGDREVHEAAVAVRVAAEAEDRDALRTGFHRLMNGCLNCHAQFRERVRATEE